MNWLEEFKDRHRSGYIHAGRCLSCRRGEDGCIGGRHKNECTNYLDNTPKNEEHLEIYADLLRKLFAAEREPEKGNIYGAAQSRRQFLIAYFGIKGEFIRAIEDLNYRDSEKNEWYLRRLRCET